MTAEVLVTGGTGRIGGAVLKHLLEDHGLRPRALVRNASSIAPSVSDRIASIVGDFSDHGALAEAVDGVDAIFLISPVHPDQCALQGNVARAAAASGKPLIVKVSGLGTTLDSFVDSGRWHAETEADIQTLGLPFTFLQPYFFMQNLGFSLASARSEGVIRAAVGDARIAMVDYRDIAEVAAKLLAGSADLSGQALPITGAEAVDYAQVARTFSDHLDRTVVYERQTLAEARQGLAKSGQPDWHVELLLQFNRAFLEGLASATNELVEDVLGRAPRTLDAYVAELASDDAAVAGENPFPS